MTALPQVEQAAPEIEMRTGLPDVEVRRRLALAMRREETGARVLAFYLVEMDGRRLYQTSGHGSTAHYAEVGLGIDRRRTCDLLHVGRTLLELVEVDGAFCAGRLGWAKVLVLARVATPKHEAEWLERALALDCRRLAALARRSKPGGPPRKPSEQKGLPEIRFPLGVSVGVLGRAKVEQAQAKLAAELGREVSLAELFEALAGDFLASEADGSVPGRKRVDASIYRVIVREDDDGGPGGTLLAETEEGPLPIESAGAVRCDAEELRQQGESQLELDVKTPPPLRRKVLVRDEARCRSCASRHDLMVHHMEFRGEGGRTSAENLITLCTRCHALVHEGLLVLEGATAGEVRFLDAAKRPLELGEPVAAITPPAPQGAAEREFVMLDAVPEVVDGAWWERHAHLFHERKDGTGLRFEAGEPREPVQGRGTTVAEPADGDPFAGLVGQDETVRRFKIAATGARLLGHAFAHTLLTGPAGTGKTRLARSIAACLGRRPIEVLGPMTTDKPTWLRLLAALEEGGVLFLDEAHALPRPLLEMLLEALSEARLTLTVSDGVRARTITLALPRFTLLAATTEEGLLPVALRSRFGLRERLIHYEVKALSTLLLQAAAAKGAEVAPEAAARLAETARGTPREALRLLDRALDDCAAQGTPRLDAEAVEGALARLGYDEHGLDATERRYVQVLRRSRRPVPLSRLSRTLGLSPSTLVESVEPHLFERGLVCTTLAGRMATPAA